MADETKTTAKSHDTNVRLAQVTLGGWGAVLVLLLSSQPDSWLGQMIVLNANENGETVVSWLEAVGGLVTVASIGLFVSALVVVLQPNLENETWLSVTFVFSFGILSLLVIALGFQAANAEKYRSEISATATAP